MTENNTSIVTIYAVRSDKADNDEGLLLSFGFVLLPQTTNKKMLCFNKLNGHMAVVWLDNSKANTFCDGHYVREITITNLRLYSPW